MDDKTIATVALMMLSGASFATEVASLPEEVLATRTVIALGQAVTLLDTKRIEEDGKVVYCQQHVAGSYLEEKTHLAIVQLGSTCRIGAMGN